MNENAEFELLNYFIVSIINLHKYICTISEERLITTRDHWHTSTHIEDDGPTLNQRWFTVLYLLGYLHSGVHLFDNLAKKRSMNIFQMNTII